MEWDRNLDLGIEVIDKQHMRIVDFINELHLAATTSDNELIDHVINELTSYTVSHFAFEEELFEKYDYHLKNAHKRVHKSFVDRITDYKKQHEDGKNIALKLAGELQIWLASHIKNEDADYAANINININNETKTGISKLLSRFFK